MSIFGHAISSCVWKWFLSPFFWRTGKVEKIGRFGDFSVLTAQKDEFNNSENLLWARDCDKPFVNTYFSL